MKRGYHRAVPQHHEAAPPGHARVAGRAAVAVVLAALVADLLLGARVPGVAGAVAWLFEGAAAAAQWVVDGRLGFAAAGAVGLVGAAALPGAAGRVARAVAGAVGAVLLLGGIAVAAMMEPALALGLGAAGLAASSQAPRAVSPRLIAVAAGLAALGAGLWGLQLFAADSQGYGVLELLGAHRGALRVVPWLLGAAGLAAWVGASPRHLAPAALALGVAAVGLLLDRALPWPSLLLAPALAGWWRLRPASTAPLVTRLAVPAALAAALLAHTYAVRVFGCPDSPHPALERVAEPGAVFRVALGPDGQPLLALREARGWARFDGQGLVPLEPAPVPARPAAERSWLGESLASTEELVGGARVFGTVLGGHPDYYSLPDSPPNTVHNQIVELGADGPIAVHSPERLCWVGALLSAYGALWAGCEYESTLHRLDPDTAAVQASVEDPRLGDVAALAQTPAGLATASFWHGRRLVLVDPATAAVAASAVGPGGHYDLAWEPRQERLWVSSYTRSRVVAFDAELNRVDSIRTGLGARALAVDPARGWLLASSVYDGVVRVCEGGEVLSRLRVGGHVKDIAVDPERGLAWFASRCGLWRLDLAALDASLR